MSTRFPPDVAEAINKAAADMADNPEAWEQLYGTQVAPRELTTQAKPTEAESIDALKQPTGSISDKGGTLADTGDSGSIKGVDKEREALRSGLGLDEDQAKVGESTADMGEAQGASSIFEEGLTGKPSKWKNPAHMDKAMKAGVTNDDVLSLIDNNSDAALKNGSKFTEPTLKEPGKPGGQPKCKPGKINSRGSLREDEAAVKLTQSRYNTIQLPEVDGGNGKGIKKGTNPDLLIEGEVFDCYSPETSSVGNIYKVVQDKSTTQASRVILNLEDYKGSVDDLVKCFYDNPIPTLDELLIINKDQVLCIYIK